jgi:hypothetical protein
MEKILLKYLFKLFEFVSTDCLKHELLIFGIVKETTTLARTTEFI